MRHRPITYTVEDPSGGRFRHVAGVNDICPSFRPGHFLSAGRDSKLLEWRLPDGNTASASAAVVVDAAASSFSIHGDQVNRLLPLPGYGFISAGADNVIALCPVQEVAGSGGASYEVATKGGVSSGPTTVVEFPHHAAAVKAMCLLGDLGDSSSSNNGGGIDGSSAAAGDAGAAGASASDRLVACCADSTVSVVSLRGDKLLHSGVKSMPVSVAPTGHSSFYLGCLNGSVQAVDVRTKLSITDFIEDAHGNVIRDMLWIRQRNLLVTAGSDALIRVWDCRNVMDPVLTIDAHGDAVWRLQRLAPHAGDLPGFCAAAGDDVESQCFVSAGREGTLQAHDAHGLRTALLAQCSYPILSFHMMPSASPRGGNVAVVGTCSSDILAFRLDKSRVQHVNADGSSPAFDDGALLGGDRTPAGKPARPSSAASANSPGGGLTPSAIRIDLIDDNATKPQQAAAATLPRALDPPQRFGVAAPFVDLQEEQPTYRSPFKPPRTDARDHLQWASFTEKSIPRPPVLSAASASSSSSGNDVITFRGGVGFVKTAQFPTRIHAAVARSDGTIAVWDVVNCHKVADLAPGVQFDHVVALLESLPALCGSWCSMSCSWGCVSVSVADTDGSTSNLNEWELDQLAGNIYLKIIMDALAQLPTTTTTTASSPATKSPVLDAAAVTAATAAAAKEQVVKALLDPKRSNTVRVAASGGGAAASSAAASFCAPSVAAFPLPELRRLRLVRNINLWAIKRLVKAARAGRLTKFLVRNLQCHQTDTDRRALYELPLLELSSLPLTDDEFAAAQTASQVVREREEAEAKRRGEAGDSAAGAAGGHNNAHGDDADDENVPPPVTDPPPFAAAAAAAAVAAAGGVGAMPAEVLVGQIAMHHRRAPRWLIMHAAKSDLLKASATVPSTSFTCDPFGKNDALPIAGLKLLPAAFSDKKPPLQLPRTSLLAELCGFIAKAIKKNAPTFNQLQEARAALQMPLLHRESAVLPPSMMADDKGSPSSSSTSSPPSPPGSRKAEPEEWIVLFASSGAVLDPSLTVGMAFSLFRQKDERNLTIKYAAVVMG